MSFRAPRLKAFDYLGEFRYSLTFCTLDRARVFEDGECVRVARAQIQRAAEIEGFDVPVYCFMPDHLHWLAVGRSPASELTRLIKTSKQLSGFVYKQRTGKTLWQRSGWDHVLRSDEDFLALVKYILSNPVRAGLVEKAEDYPFSGSFSHTRDELMEYIGCART